MNGVINRKDAIGAILSVGHIAELSDGDAVIRVSAVNYVLRNLPSADAQPVILCKDCMNWIPGYITDTDEFIPPKCGKYQQMVGHSSDDFCSYGERKDGERHE